VSTLLVGYDLNRPGQNYADLTKFLKSHTTWCHPVDSTWLVVTSKTTSELRDEIKRFIDSTDDVLVIDVTGDSWSTFGMSSDVNGWFHTNM
jgi:CRISPR/Cas system-associated endoribonuclease Cas2